MHTEIITRREDVRIGREEWNRLLSTSETNTVFQTYEWVWAWWNAFGARHRLRLVIVRDGDKLLALAPMMIGALRGKPSLRFIGEDNSDYCDVIAGEGKREALTAVLQALMSFEAWNVVQLKNVPEQSTTLSAAREFCAEAGRHMLAGNGIACPALVIEGEVEHARRVTGTKTIRRRCNYLRRMGGFRVFHVGTVEEAIPYLDLFIAQHIRRWKGTASPSVFLRGGTREFYIELVKTLLPDGVLLFTVLEFQGRPIAFHLGFDYNSKLIWYKPSFDPDYRRLSPGTVLLKHLIDYSLERGHCELDFTIGDEPFKRKFANRVRKNGQIRIYEGAYAYYRDLALEKMLRLKSLID